MSSPSEVPHEAAPPEEPSGTSGATPGVRRRGRSFVRRHLAWLLLAPDLVILYAAFLGALKARFGDWTAPGEVGLAGVLVLALFVYPAALALAGTYRTDPRAMHLPQFLRAATGMGAAWAVCVAFTYLAGHGHIPPRSITALHCLLSMIGVLGLRALVRRTLEWRQPSSDVTGEGDAPAHEGRASLQIEEVLPRVPVTVHTGALRDYLAGRTVLVTGAGGSIGTELTQQLLALRPFRLVLVDISEYNLFQLENALRGAAFDGEIEFCIGDVRDRDIMDGLFADLQPDVVLHTAAYKHVPLMERHPAEAFRNNTLATTVLLELCRAHGAEQFVFVSTDKAVEPKGVLGATKRLAEWYVRSREHFGGPDRSAEAGPKCKIVRFGNVFGSQGSVVPLFERQLRESGAVSVTHPDMERYFMSAHEACSLILQTLLMDDAPVYMFDMGEPVSIQWLAEEVVRHVRPGVPDPAALVEHTGVRPGEKLREKLRTAEEVARPTAHDRIVGLHSDAPLRHAVIAEHLRRLEALCAERRDAPLRKALSSEDVLGEEASSARGDGASSAHGENGTDHENIAPEQPENLFRTP